MKQISLRFHSQLIVISQNIPVVRIFQKDKIFSFTFFVMAARWLAPFAVLSILLVVLRVTTAGRPLDALDARPGIPCFRCVPNAANRFCADDQVEGSQADCTAGRCLMMGAKFKGSNDVARLYECDSANIVDWAFQLLLDQGSDDLPPNTCKLIDFGSPHVLDTFRNYGMNSAITALLRGTTSGAELESQVDQVEICTCENALCNSVGTNQKISLISRGDRPLPPPPPGPRPDPDVPCADCGLPWYWILLYVLWSLLLLLLLSTLALWLYKRSKKPSHREPFNPNRDNVPRPGYRAPDRHTTHKRT